MAPREPEREEELDDDGKPKSKYKGVVWNPKGDKDPDAPWRPQYVSPHGTPVCFGSPTEEVVAARTYDRFIIALLGPTHAASKINFKISDYEGETFFKELFGPAANCSVTVGCRDTRVKDRLLELSEGKDIGVQDQDFIKIVRGTVNFLKNMGACLVAPKQSNGSQGGAASTTPASSPPPRASSTDGAAGPSAAQGGAEKKGAKGKIPVFIEGEGWQGTLKLRKKATFRVSRCPSKKAASRNVDRLRIALFGIDAAEKKEPEEASTKFEAGTYRVEPWIALLLRDVKATPPAPKPLTAADLDSMSAEDLKSAMARAWTFVLSHYKGEDAPAAPKKGDAAASPANKAAASSSSTKADAGAKAPGASASAASSGSAPAAAASSSSAAAPKREKSLMPKPKAPLAKRPRTSPAASEDGDAKEGDKEKGPSRKQQKSAPASSALVSLVPSREYPTMVFNRNGRGWSGRFSFKPGVHVYLPPCSTPQAAARNLDRARIAFYGVAFTPGRFCFNTSHYEKEPFYKRLVQTKGGIGLFDESELRSLAPERLRRYLRQAWDFVLRHQAGEDCGRECESGRESDDEHIEGGPAGPSEQPKSASAGDRLTQEERAAVLAAAGIDRDSAEAYQNADGSFKRTTRVTSAPAEGAEKEKKAAGRAGKAAAARAAAAAKQQAKRRRAESDSDESGGSGAENGIASSRLGKIRQVASGWQAVVRYDGVSVPLSVHATEKEAARELDRVGLALHGQEQGAPLLRYPLSDYMAEPFFALVPPKGIGERGEHSTPRQAIRSALDLIGARPAARRAGSARKGSAQAAAAAAAAPAPEGPSYKKARPFRCWVSSVEFMGNVYDYGVHRSEEEALRASDRAHLVLHGPFTARSADLAFPLTEYEGEAFWKRLLAPDCAVGFRDKALLGPDREAPDVKRGVVRRALAWMDNLRAPEAGVADEDGTAGLSALQLALLTLEWRVREAADLLLGDPRETGDRLARVFSMSAEDLATWRADVKLGGGALDKVASQAVALAEALMPRALTEQGRAAAKAGWAMLSLAGEGDEEPKPEPMATDGQPEAGPAPEAWVGRPARDARGLEEALALFAERCVDWAWCRSLQALGTR